MNSIIIEFLYGIEEDEPFYELVNKLIVLLSNSVEGYYDGHEMAMDNSHGRLFMYGSNSEKLYKKIKSVLDETDFLKGASAYLQFESNGPNPLTLELKVGM
jgi:hypothetical protein